MKRLILLRHAKSSWVNPDLDDFDRPLNKRGKRSARELGKWLREAEHRPGQVLCSAARRARETWEGLALEGAPELRQDLYNAPSEGLFDALRAAEAPVVMLIAHNPGIAAFAHEILAAPPDHARFADYPTGALLVADFPVGEWSEVRAATGRAVVFVIPQDLADIPA
ncbi:MAG: SixA phosphatase family protein [Tropicimonas sp.]|uniref:SixA phosphatase family protein n=1 Tax=Tropicimonas sp. TaxID=2067044 RepID=UPI003A85410B